MSSKARLTAIIGIVVLAALIGLGPIIVARIATNVFKPAKNISSAPVRIKAFGKISIIDNNVILTSPKGLNHYVISGPNADRIQKLAQSPDTVYVFGNLVKANPGKVSDLPIRANIEVSQFDVKDFNPIKEMPANVMEAIRAKVEARSAFREKVLGKLKLNSSGMDVISGKLVLGKAMYITPKKPSQIICPILIDKYGDVYVLNGLPFTETPVEKYQQIVTSGLEVVAVGQVVLPDPKFTLLYKNNYVTFNVQHKLLNNNEELSELVVK